MKYVRCTVRDCWIRSKMFWSSTHTKIWTLKQLHHCTQWKNCEETRWRSQSAPVWPLAKSRLDAKISLVPKHQLIVPSTLLAPATQPKKTKPQRYIRSDHWHTSNFFQNSSIMIIKICFKELKCYFFNINIMNNTHTHIVCKHLVNETWISC